MSDLINCHQVCRTNINFHVSSRLLFKTLIKRKWCFLWRKKNYMYGVHRTLELCLPFLFTIQCLLLFSLSHTHILTHNIFYHKKKYSIELYWHFICRQGLFSFKKNNRFNLIGNWLDLSCWRSQINQRTSLNQFYWINR